MDSEIFTVKVTYTDRTRDSHGFVERYTEVIVMADSDNEAELVAVHMAYCTIPDQWIVIGTEITEVLI